MIKRKLLNWFDSCRVLDSLWTNTKRKVWNSTCSSCADWPAVSSNNFPRCAPPCRVCRSTIRALSSGASMTSRRKSLKLESRKVSSSSRLHSTPANTDTNCRYVPPVHWTFYLKKKEKFIRSFFFNIHLETFLWLITVLSVFRRHCFLMVTGREKELTSPFTSKSYRESTTPSSNGLSLTQFPSRSTTKPPIPTR